MTLHGLLPEERRWLARKARLLGGLEPALRLLLRNGRLCDLALREWELETRCDAPSARLKPGERYGTAWRRVRRGADRRRGTRPC
jgi:hypothetical protein